MKKKNHSMNLEGSLGFGATKKDYEQIINSDLDCVLVDDNSRTNS